MADEGAAGLEWLQDLSGIGMLGSRSLFPFLVRHRPEMVIALGDVWWLPYFSAPHVRRQMQLTDTPWALYFPIDGDMEGGGLPASWIQLLNEVDIPIAMSEFGRDAASKSGISLPLYSSRGGPQLLLSSARIASRPRRRLMQRENS